MRGTSVLSRLGQIVAHVHQLTKWALVRGPRRRTELAWSEADRLRTEAAALACAPREGAVIALCRRSTGRERDTFIVTRPILPHAGDLSYQRGFVVTITSRYWNRAIDALSGEPAGTGVAVLHTHPGRGVPVWSDDDDNADAELARFLFGEGFLTPGAPLVSLVATHTDRRGRAISLDRRSNRVSMVAIERVRTIGAKAFNAMSTVDRKDSSSHQPVPTFADRSVRVFGKEGQRRLADLHIAVVGAGGVGSICAEHLARWGVGAITCWDPDRVAAVNINRSGVFTFRDARRARSKARTLARALRAFSLVRDLRVRWRDCDVRERTELAQLLDADMIVMLVDDARPRHFINRLAYAHYIPVLDGGNVIRSTAEDDGNADTATIEGGGIRVSYLAPDGPCLWCAGHLTPNALSLAYRSENEKAADRARGYVEHLGPEHAPSVMPLNALNAGLLEMRLMDLVFALSGHATPELYFDMLGGTLDALPRTRRPSCRQCALSEGLGDLIELPHAGD
jgi:hypothetical protein